MESVCQHRRSSKSSKSSIKPELCFLLILPIELLVHIVSFLTSARDRTVLRYVSKQLRVVVNTPSLWRDFTWSHFDFREHKSVESVLKLCGKHVMQLSFPDLVVPVLLLRHCRNLVQLSLPSAELSLEQLRKVMRPMRNLQYLDVLWRSVCIKPLLSVCARLEELTVRDAGTSNSGLGNAVFYRAFRSWLNEWGSANAIPQRLNFVTGANIPLNEFALHLNASSLATHPDDHRYLKVYDNFKDFEGFFPALPKFQLQFGHSCTLPLANVSKYGLLGLDSDVIFLTDHMINGIVSYKAVMMRNNGVATGPINSAILSAEFVTHFDASCCDALYSGHLEQLAITCPNLQQLNLQNNLNCLKNLQGLKVLSSCCVRLEGLNILGISVKEVENSVKLWEILVDLKLVYLAIEFCCLLCFEVDVQTKETISILQQKCFKMKALESSCCVQCIKCAENTQPLLLTNFPSLVQCLTNNIDIIDNCGSVRYLRYTGNNISCSWLLPTCNLKQLCILSDQLVLPDHFMNTVSAHGGLVHVVLSVHFVTQNGIIALIENSLHLIVFHIHIRTLAVWRILFNIKGFNSTLEKKYSNRKLFLCGSYRLIKGSLPHHKLRDLSMGHNMDLTSLW